MADDEHADWAEARIEDRRATLLAVILLLACLLDVAPF
jgi:hypothetical protein